MREVTHDGNQLKPVLDAQMSKMSPEQRVAMASLNEEAKKREAERIAYDKAKEEKHMENYPPLKVETSFKEAHGKDIAVPTAKEAAASMPAPSEGEKFLPDPLGPKQDVPQVTNSLRYTQSTLADEFARIFETEIMALRNAGQKEYAHDDSSPFANFERGAKDMGIDRKQVLWVYAMKHKDGIASFLKGHVSQREDVRGRINDLITYLLLLYTMVNEEVGSLAAGGAGLGNLRK